jgi:DNA-directed RNA polymerase specialized sigma24 family protein
MSDKTETLFCEAGKHDWTRDRKRGKKPRNCPQHQTEKDTADREERLRKMAEGRERAQAEERRRKLEEVLNKPLRESCTCVIKPDVTLEELKRMRGCKEGYVCSRLDRARRALGH